MIVFGANNIISPLGWTSEENFKNILEGKTGLTIQDDKELSDVAFPVAKIKEIDIQQHLEEYPDVVGYSKLEQLCILSLKQIIANVDVKNPKTGFVFSTTKGNVDLLKEEEPGNDVYLGNTAQSIANYFGFQNTPHVISNACISGLAAIVFAKRMISSGIYDQVVLLGADILSKFIVSGFQSFQSLSAEPCKPYDANRDGLSLGEAVGSIILYKKEGEDNSGEIEVVNGAISNDANHISGPSRTGEGLYRAIQQATRNNARIDVISSHGTATPYNDDMESHAISRSGLSDVPVSGLKGYFGHTLGAAGIIESIISTMALKENVVIATKGIQQQGVVQPITVANENIATSTRELLKLMSGFGGCNAAVYFKKHE
ncbi:beta-ketoacyl-[acyl-carrier-protein] synthase family protein [Plebeiibacterium sediminum]|uniref:Ketosynthase family 3 (KS3) domain-containing protein n=1 Tax=Plebeiibacterium sediminum TaxID=2992112 RepID=A0AAE3SDS0_9BACT|nr:beta-ketoacyl synthase N-terminal-like domain-containing protein [Plebeiobacterium sediminum]MCW3785550.1 hypothetical protein [Plebeiobacterium sediminum]